MIKQWLKNNSVGYSVPIMGCIAQRYCSFLAKTPNTHHRKIKKALYRSNPNIRRVGNWLSTTILTILIAIIATSCSQEHIFHTTDNQRFSFEKAKGQWLLVNYWAEWCKPCLKEIPEMNKIHQADGIQVVGVNFDQLQDEALQTQIEKHNIQYPVLTSDPKDYLQLGEPIGLPLSYLLNKEGVVIEKLYGPQTKESILQIIRQRP